MNLLNAPWQTIVNENGKVELQNCMSREGLISLGADFSMGDYINTWDFEAGTWGLPYYYVDQPIEFGEEYTDTWCNWEESDPLPDVVELDPGAAFWLYHGGDSKITLTFDGQVASGTCGYTLTGGRMNLCGNPYPAVLDLNTKAGQVVITGATSLGADFSMGDYINTWDFEAGTWGLPYYYVNQPIEFGEDYTDVWCNWEESDPIPDATNIPVGSGFWYYACDTVSLTFVNPVAK